MCVTYCHRQRVLFWNHDTCSFEVCPVVGEEHGRCCSCRYARGQTCALTRVPLPTVGGCCHWNVNLVTGPQLVTPEMLAPLGIVGPEPIEAILAGLDAPYQRDAAGQAWVDPDRLGLPEVYGVGTEELAPEVMDWSTRDMTWFQVDGSER